MARTPHDPAAPAPAHVAPEGGARAHEGDAGPPEADAAARARLTELYDRHGRDVLAYAMRRAPSSDDAADALAETFLVAWRRLSDVPAEPAARPWLYGVARRTLLNQRRGKKRRESLAERLRLEARSALPVPPADERSEAVLAALSALPADDRELLALVVWEELLPSEAARVLEISPVAARVRLHRARRRLRDVLAEDAPGPLCHTRQAHMEEAG